MTIRFKPEVRITYCTEEIFRVMQRASVWSLLSRVDLEVNSLNDSKGVHLPESLHYFDLAIDLDTVGDKAADTQALGEYLRRALPPGYDVLFEGDHVHVEFDAHRPALRKLVS